MMHVDVVTGPDWLKKEVHIWLDAEGAAALRELLVRAEARGFLAPLALGVAGEDFAMPDEWLQRSLKLAADNSESIIHETSP